MKVIVEDWGNSGKRVIIQGLFGGELALSVDGANNLSKQLAQAVEQLNQADADGKCPECGYAHKPGENTCCSR